MVRRFIEDQKIRLLHHQTAKQQPRSLSSRQRLGRLQPFFSAEQHLSQHAANIFLGRLRIELMQPVRSRRPFFNGRGMVLRKITDLRFMPPLHLAAIDVFVRIFSRRVGHMRSMSQQRFDKGGLSLAVAADQANLLTTRYGSAESIDDNMVPVGLANPFRFQNMFAGRAQLIEANVGASDIRPCQLAGLQPLHFLFARGHLAGSRTGRKPRDKFIQLRDLLFALLILRFQSRPHLRLGQHHIVVATGVGDDGLVIDVCNMRANVIQEITIVRNRDQRTFAVGKKVFQPVDGVQIQIVRRLIQQQRLRIAEQSLCQQNSHLLTALQLAHLSLMHFVRNVEALQKNRGIALRGVPVFFANNAFQLAQTHAVGIVQFMLLVDPVALFQSRPQTFVAHNDRIDHAIGIERILVLAQHAQLFRAHHHALLRVEIAAQDLHKRGFSGSVGPGQAIAATRGKCGGDIFKQDLRSIAHAYIADRNHIYP